MTETTTSQECPIQVVLAGEFIDCTFARGHGGLHSWQIPGAPVFVIAGETHSRDGEPVTAPRRRRGLGPAGRTRTGGDMTETDPIHDEHCCLSGGGRPHPLCEGCKLPACWPGAEATPERPVYAKVAHEGGGETQLWMITCNEGWRSSIVCQDMYGWAADWLVEQLQGKPFAPGRRPGSAPEPFSSRVRI